ncbi:hypothetical protein B0H14DRAFT_344018 [Mycena olivaceomarginata]|nr:hypothetical protein B0H14DRAFT_344018 [Mycena olivaceomarginata]
MGLGKTHFLSSQRTLVGPASANVRPNSAEWSVWISAASILATFEISKSIDEKGVPIEPSGEYTSGLLCYPIPHQCDILPRSEAARALIQSGV